jgi:putative transposase
MRRIKAEPADTYGQVVNKNLVRAIMRAQGLPGLPVRRRRKANLAHKLTAEDLVNRDFRRDDPNQLWMTDITKHPTREGTLYCCVVLDAGTRRGVGWSIDRRPTAAMVNSALGMEIDGHRPEGTVIHSDSETVGASRSCGA